MLLADPDLVGFKVLEPQAVGTACGATLWSCGERRSRLAAKAVNVLLRSHPEANAVRDAEVRWRGLDTVLVQAGCVSIRGDVGRVVSTVSVPMLGEHSGHGSHSTP
jgi:hypothetical protein